MSFHYYAVSDDKGEILQIYGTQNTFTPCDAEVSDTTHYLDTNTGVLERKRDINPEVTTNGLQVTITNLPPGTRIFTNGMEGYADINPTVILYDVPGTYSIELVGLVEYRETSLEVTVGNS